MHQVVRAMIAVAIIGAWAVTTVTAVGARSASGSMLVDRNTSSQTLAVDSQGNALVTYRARGANRKLLAWGAINSDLVFQTDRTGGTNSKRANPRSFQSVCGAYSGPRVQYAIAACTMPDGSHWVLQEWMRIIKVGGNSGPKELRLSHFTGDLAVLSVATDWSWNGRYRHMYGTYTYNGRGVFGNSWRSDGYVLDKLGRNIMIDSYDSDFGAGWRRVNGFLSNKPYGEFCYGFTPKGSIAQSGRSASEWYFASTAGPGVSPDVFLMFRGQLGAYDTRLDAQHNEVQGQLTNWASSGPCSKRN